MASSRHLGRIVALQTLYEYDFYKDDSTAYYSVEEILKRHIKHRAKSLDQPQFTIDLVKGIIAKQKELDAIIQPLAPQRPLHEIPLIDHCVLQIGIYELHYGEDTPYKVVINEAVELAKHFGGENSSRFINGVLGTYYAQKTTDQQSEVASGDKSISDEIAQDTDNE